MNCGSHLLILVLGFCVTGQVKVDSAFAEKLELSASGPSDDVVFLKERMKVEIEKLGWTLEGHLKTFNPPFDRFSPMLVPRARRDLNKDGIEELEHFPIILGHSLS